VRRVDGPPDNAVLHQVPEPFIARRDALLQVEEVGRIDEARSSDIPSAVT